MTTVAMLDPTWAGKPNTYITFRSYSKSSLEEVVTVTPLSELPGHILCRGDGIGRSFGRLPVVGPGEVGTFDNPFAPNIFGDVLWRVM